jgi:hypothetical protein
MGDTKKPISSDDLFSLVKEGKPAGKSTPVSSENFATILQNAQAPEGMPLSDVAVQAYTNAPQSALNFAKGLYESITNPKQTLSSISDLMQAGLSKVIPESMIDPNAQPAIGRGKVAGQAMAEHFKERYGSAEGFKQALAKDPIGVASDISTVLSMGSAGAGAYGKLAELGSTATTAKIAKGARATEKALETAAKYTNPLTAVTSTVGLGGKHLLGISTGTGSENIANAAKAGFEGDKTFQRNLRGEAPMTEALDNARHNLNVMRQNRSQAYRSGMVDITNDKNVLDFADIDNSLNKALKETTFHGEIIDEAAHSHLENLKEKIDAWKKKNPDIYHTPEGLDKLKQMLGAENEKIPYEAKSVGRVGKNIYDSVKSTIADQAPTYSKVMSDYTNASENISEIERGLSLGNRASADTALRKLQSLTRNNVNTNYGNRLDLAKQLEMEGGRPFISALSGQALSSPVARGAVGGGLEGAALLSALANPTSPYTLAAIPFQTPRLVGEGLYAGGRVGRKLSDFADVTGLNPRNANALADLLYTEQQTNPYRVELSNMLPNRP